MTEKAIALAEWIGIAITVGGFLIAVGRISAQYKQLTATVVAVHRRIDELEYMLTAVREAMIAAGMLRPMRSSHSKPPLTLATRDEDPTPS